MLDLDRIDVDELAMALDDHSYDHWWWLDRDTGEIHLRSEWGDNEDDLDPDDVDGIRIDPTPSRVSYRDLEEFASAVRDPRARDLLLRAIEGRGAFRRFKDTLFEFPDLREAWFAFENARTRRRAVEWLLENEVVAPDQARAALATFADPPLSGFLRKAVDPDAIAAEAAAELRRLYGDRFRRVLLFGSWARGDADDESDIDLLVVLADVASPFAESRRMSDLLWELTERHDVVVSAVPVSEQDFEHAPTAFLARVRAEGRDAA